MSGARSMQPGVNRVAGAALLVAFCFGIDKVLGIVRDVAVGRAFGASAALDAYYAAFELPDGLFTLIAGSALTTAFIPILTEWIAKEDASAVWRLVSAVLNWVLLIVAALSVGAALAAPAVIHTIAPGFDAERAQLATQLMRLVLLQTLVSCASGIVMSTLQAHQHFLLPALAPLSYTLGRILGTLWLAPHWGIFGLAWGGLAGAVGHLLIQIPGLVRYGARWSPNLRHPALGAVLRLMGPRMLGLGATYLNFVLPTFFGSRLAAGAIASYEYGWRLMQFPETLIGTALGLTLFPTLAQYANADDRAGLRRTTGWALRLVLALAIPAAVGMALLGEPLTALLLQRGAFDAAATARVGGVLRYLALALTAHSLLEVVGRLFYARRDMWTPLWAALLGLALNAGIAYSLLPTLAQSGIALANGLGALAQVLVLGVVARIRLGGLEERALAGALGRAGLTAAALALAILALGALGAALPLWLKTVLQLTGGGVAYLASAWALKSAEWQSLLEALRWRRSVNGASHS